MTIKKVAKAIAGAVMSLASTWLVALWGFEVPAEALNWGTGVLASGIAVAIGGIGTFLSPKNSD